MIKDTPRVDLWRSMFIWLKMKDRKLAKLKQGEYYVTG